MIKFTLVQINATIGDIEGNCKKICFEIQKNNDADVLVFPELVLQGYLPYDFFSYVQHDILEQSLQAIISSLRDTQIAMIGVALPLHFHHLGNTHNLDKIPHTSDIVHNHTYYNCVVVLSNEGIFHIQVKHILPYYDVFFENRYFLSGLQTQGELVFHEYDSLKLSEHSPGIKVVQSFDCSTGVFSYEKANENITIGVLICEDIWYAPDKKSPIMKLQELKPDIIICMSASPFEHNKLQKRIEVSTRAAKLIDAPLLFVNLVGANDEVVFDGRSFIIDSDTSIIAMLAHCKEDVGSIDWDNGKFENIEVSSNVNTYQNIKNPISIQDGMEDITKVLELGLVDYLKKTNIAQSVHLGLSGGIDSAVTATLAVNALGSKQVVGVLLPSRFTSKESVVDALELAENLQISTITLSIEDITLGAINELKTVFEQANNTSTLAEENLQARMRGVLLMAYSNKLGSMLLTTGNKSEIAVGYCTLYGDMCGALNLIGDLYKTEVYQLAEYLNVQSKKNTGVPVIPQNIIDKAPTAELRENQKDTDSLPPYALLDAILHKFIEEKSTPIQLIKENVASKEIIYKVWNLYIASEYKRYQAPPIIKISSNAFGRGRLVPLVHKQSGK